MMPTAIRTEVIISFTKTDVNNWTWSAVLEGDETNTKLGPEDPNERTIVFNDNGTISSGETGTVTIPASLLALVENTDVEFTLDLTGVRQYADETSVAVTMQTGIPKGDLDSISIDENGILIGSCSTV